MKIYWTNILWNYTICLWLLFKYRNSKFRAYYCSKKYWCLKQKRTHQAQMLRIIREGKFTGWKNYTFVYKPKEKEVNS